MDDLSVEIRRKPGILLKGKVLDLSPDGVLVELDNVSQTQREYPFSEVVFPSKPENINYTVGESIEVCQALESEEGVECWLAGVVHLVKGDFVVPVLEHHQDRQEIFSSDNVRRPNKNEPITSESILSHSITIPEELSQICMDNSNHKEFLQRCGASLIHFKNKQNILLVLSTDEAVIKKARLLGDMHVKGLKQKSALFQMMKDASKKLEQSSRHHHHPIAKHLDSFTVHKELMGLAIGSHGNNIQQAKQLPGIKGIELEENTGTFTVSGDTTEAVGRARAVLEFKKEVVELPKCLIARVIGKNGHHIQDIVDKSGVVRVQIKSEEERGGPVIDENELIPFVFIGTADSISNARLLMDYHVTHLKEVEQLTQQKRQLDAELRNLSINNNNNHPSFMFRHPRHNREADMDHDHMRGGGGGMRGNRGGGRGIRGGMRYPGNNVYPPPINDQRHNFPGGFYSGDDNARGRGRFNGGGRFQRPPYMRGGFGKGKRDFPNAGGEGEGEVMAYKHDGNHDGIKGGNEGMINGQG